jgi:hypothetical protein
MALSYNFFPDRDTIIKAALRRCRAYDPEDATTISTVQYNNAAETLNFILSHWQAHGLPIWCRKTTSMTLVEGDADYTIGSGATINVNRPLMVTQAYLRDSTDSANPVDIELDIISQQEYHALPNKMAEGRPVQLYYDAAYDGSSNSGTTAAGTLYIWPTPDATTATNCTIKLLYQRPLLDYNASTDVLDMPQEWFEAIRLNLAWKIAPEYGLPVSEYDRLGIEAKDALNLALSWDTEQTPVFFQPEYRR